MNSLVRVHMPATYFSDYQALRDELMAILTDDDLGFRVGGAECDVSARSVARSARSNTPTSSRSGRFGRTSTIATRIRASRRASRPWSSWYAELDRDLTDAIAALSEDDIANRRIVRNDFDVSDFSPLSEHPARHLSGGPADLLRESQRVSASHGKAAARSLAALDRMTRAVGLRSRRPAPATIRPMEIVGVRITTIVEDNVAKRCDGCLEVI